MQRERTHHEGSGIRAAQSLGPSNLDQIREQSSDLLADAEAMAATPIVGSLGYLADNRQMTGQ